MSFLPLTTVRLCRAVPLSNNYKDQLTFTGLADQQVYFNSKTQYSAQDLTYQREEMFIRYPAEYDSVVDCNYLCYQNPAFSQKWFYAFITDVRYENEGMTRIYFEIDSYQTFMFDIQIPACFVEREHVNDDSVGANLIDEGLALGDYVATAFTQKNFTDWWIVIGSTVDLKDTSFPEDGGYVYAGIYSGASYYLFDSDGWSTGSLLPALIKALNGAGKGDALVTMYMVPKDIVPGGQSGGYLPTSVRTATNIAVPNTNTLNGYTPKNNKLLCYPYRCLQISNNDGNAVTLRYEFFNGQPNVVFRGVATPNGRIICYPQEYAGVTINLNESISLGNYPQCTWQNSAYANWLAAQSIRWGYEADRWTFGTAVNSLGALATGLTTGNVAPALNLLSSTAQQGYNMVSSMAEEKEVHSITPPAVKGSIGNGYTNVSLYRYGFILEQRTIKAEIARSIDEYFSAFGYKVNRVKVPNITGRPSWNYVKTIGARVIGGAPTPHLNRIKSMLDNGVTFWHGDWVGDYSRDNGGTPVPPPTDKYTLSVIGGTGGGSFQAYENVTVVADTTVNFNQWVTRNGGYFLDNSTSTAIFVMPPNDCTIEATYNTQPTVERIDTVMRRFIGAVEWDETVGLWQRWYYGSYVKAAWCTTCLTYCASLAGVGDQVPKNEGVQKLYDDMTAMGSTWVASVDGEHPEPGDVIFFITNQSPTVLHHCGVVSSVNWPQVTYISGNTGNPGGGPDGVFEKTTTIGQGGTNYARNFGKVNYT